MTMVAITVALAMALVLALVVGSIGIAPIYVETLERHLSFLRSPFSSMVFGLAYFGPSFALASASTALLVARLARRSAILAALASGAAAPFLYISFQLALIAVLRVAVGFGMLNSASHVLLAGVAGLAFGCCFALIIALLSSRLRNAAQLGAAPDPNRVVI